MFSIKFGDTGEVMGLASYIYAYNVLKLHLLLAHEGHSGLLKTKYITLL